MKTQNIKIIGSASIHESTSLNNIIINNEVKISKNCSLYGSEENILEVGEKTYIGMNSMVSGYTRKITIGKHVSIAPNVYIMSDSGPNASQEMQKFFPLTDGEIHIGDHSWIGVASIIMPGVTLGKFCVIAANSFVDKSFPDYSVIGGNPARLIRKLSDA